MKNRSKMDPIRQIDLKATRQIRKALVRGRIPDNADLLGYVVHVPETDDYLAYFVDTPAVTQRAYTHSPEYAIRYPSPRAAEEVAKRLPKRAVVGMLFDLGERLYVAFETLDAEAH